MINAKSLQLQTAHFLLFVVNIGNKHVGIKAPEYLSLAGARSPQDLSQWHSPALMNSPYSTTTQIMLAKNEKASETFGGDLIRTTFLYEKWLVFAVTLLIKIINQSRLSDQNHSNNLHFSNCCQKTE